jgi:ParB family chromosome partitioning protein
MQSKKRALGRGLGALLPPRNPAEVTPSSQGASSENASIPSDERVERLQLEQVFPNPAQPRQFFNDNTLQELANSIRAHGLIQPILVTRKNDGYQIVAGERRWRAAQIAGIRQIPAIVLQLSEKEILEFALVENLQRESLNAIEEARAYRALINTFGLSQEEVADRVGKGRPTIANTLRLLKLPPDVQVEIESGRLSAGHARALLSVEGEELQRRLRDEILLKGLSVRQAEQRAAEIASPVVKRSKPKRANQSSDPNRERLREELIERLACKVVLKTIDGNKGKIEIYFDSLDELERVLSVLQIEM